MLLDWFIYWVIIFFVAYLIEDRGEKKEKGSKSKLSVSITFPKRFKTILSYRNINLKTTKNNEIDDFLADGFV